MPEQPINFESHASPTGEPRIQPSKVPLWLVLAITLSAGLVAAGELLPPQYELARAICRTLAAAVGAGIGVASPGLRRPGALLLACTVGLSLSACALHQHARPVPVGEPGPLPCMGARSASLAWGEVDRYMRGLLTAQEAYSCALPPATP